MAEERTLWQDFSKGLFKEAPPFGFMLGICATLATTTTVKSAFAMGMAAGSVLICSNIIISLIRKFVPNEIRIPCYIVVIASFVTMVELILKGFFPPAISETLGIFIPLIVVNCIILGRAEVFASKNSVLRSFLDGAGMGIGYMGSLLLISIIREITGAGTLLGIKVAERFEPVSIMVQAPGAFLLLGLLMGFFTWLRQRKTI